MSWCTKSQKTSPLANLWGRKSPYTYLSMCWILLPSGSSRNSLVPEMDGEKLQHHGLMPFFLVRGLHFFVLSGSLRCTVCTIHHWVYSYRVKVQSNAESNLLAIPSRYCGNSTAVVFTVVPPVASTAGLVNTVAKSYVWMTYGFDP